MVVKAVRWLVLGLVAALPSLACGDCNGGACCGGCEQAAATQVSWRQLGEAGLKKQLRLVRWELHALNHSDTARSDQILAKRAELEHLSAEYEALRTAQAALRDRLAKLFEPRPEVRLALADLGEG